MSQNKYECHITIEPVFDNDLIEFTEVCNKFNFKPAKLLMQKSRIATPERSDKDTFATSHSQDYNEILKRAQDCIDELVYKGFIVFRLKIEQILFDERYN